MQKEYFITGFLLMILFSCTERKPPENMAAWKNKGDSLVTQTFDTLRNTLMKAVGEKGFPGAVSFCNTEALHLTNTYAAEGIRVKRTSDKLRNTANTPDSLEKEMLSVFLQMKKDKQELHAVMRKDITGNYHYFKPILVQAMCLNCHGDKITQIKKGTWDMIREKYPEDSAFDYKEGDLRGTWHIVFPHAKK